MILLVLMIMYIVYVYINKNYIDNVENFAFVPWNMGTRFFPSWDLRGYPSLDVSEYKSDMNYPLIYPWNYPYPGLPYLYWSPYFYNANGIYKYNPKLSSSLNKIPKLKKRNQREIDNKVK
jgi:hypothetical protein